MNEQTQAAVQKLANTVGIDIEQAVRAVLDKHITNGAGLRFLGSVAIELPAGAVENINERSVCSVDVGNVRKNEQRQHMILAALIMAAVNRQFERLQAEASDKDAFVQALKALLDTVVGTSTFVEMQRTR